MAIFKKVKQSGKAGGGLKATTKLKNYLEQEEKIALKTTLNCSSEWDRDFELTREDKETVGKGAIHTHYILSFSNEDDLTAKECHKFAEDLIKSFDKFNDFEIAIVTHKDKEHAHSHIVINQTKFNLNKDDNIKKFHLNKQEEMQLKSKMQELTREINEYREISKDRRLLVDTRIETRSIREKVLDRRQNLSNKLEKNKNLEQKILKKWEVSKNFKEFEKLLKADSIEYRLNQKNETIKFREPNEKSFLWGDKMQNEIFHRGNFPREIEKKEIKEVIKYELERSENKKEFIQNLEEREINFSLDDDNEIYFNSYRFDTKEFFNELELDFNSFNEYFLEKERELELEIRF